MSTPLTSLPISVVIDYNLRTVTVTIQDVVVVRSGLMHALNEAILKFYAEHQDLQGRADSLLTSSGMNLRDTVIEFGHQAHRILP